MGGRLVIISDIFNAPQNLQNFKWEEDDVNAKVRAALQTGRYVGVLALRCAVLSVPRVCTFTNRWVKIAQTFSTACA